MISGRSLFPYVAIVLAIGVLVAGTTAGKGGKPKDTTPPAAVSDLAAQSTAYGYVCLTFAAVGDDGLSGTASVYDVRYATSAILTDADFEAATQVLDVPDPRGVGASEHVCVSGLGPGTTYYLALKVEDEVGNVSGLSNGASAAAGASLGDYVHVEDIRILWDFWGGPNRQVWAKVWVADENGDPVADATVTGLWEKDGKPDRKSYSGVTDCSGLAIVHWSKEKVAMLSTVTFTVTDVSHSSAEYDPDANVVTSRTSWIR